MTEAQSQHLRVTESNGVTIVAFSERKILEELSITEIGAELSKIVDGKSNVKMLISFAAVEHLSSAALGMLIKLNKQVGESGGALKLADISAQIYEVFKITRLNKIFDIHDTSEKALASF